MGRVVTYRQRVEFGDCDPVGIVWFPNYHRWLDAASRHFFIACGVPPWRETFAQSGIVGTPIVSSSATFIASASYDDQLAIHTTVREWRTKSFVQCHKVVRERGDSDPQVLLEAEEVRVFAGKDGERLTAVPIPADIANLCR